MKGRRIFETADGSSSLHVDELDEQYHSKHGAIAESRHIYIENGFKVLKHSPLHILEMGLGTGLNALLTYFESKSKDLPVNYTALEKYPLTLEEVSALNYPSFIEDKNAASVLKEIHSCPWGASQEIAPVFKLLKIKEDLRKFRTNQRFHLVYFDAFAPDVQPALWTEKIIRNLYNLLLPGGILVTYSAKGSVRRRMEKVGFTVNRIPGPAGKRHMVRAGK